MFRKLMMLLAVVGACGLVTPGCGKKEKEKPGDSTGEAIKDAAKDEKEKTDTRSSSR